MSRILKITVCIAGLLSTPSLAEGSGFSAGLTGGSLGIGPQVGYRVSEHFGLRADATFLSISHGFDSDELNYDGKVKLRSVGAMLDLYPFGGGFRVSGGARINGNKGRVEATPATTVTIGDTDYAASAIGTLSGQAETKNFAPALTLGYGGGSKQGLVFGVEAGALFQGRVRIRDFAASGGGVASADLESERKSIQDDVDDFKVYPILQLTVAYRF